MKTFRKITLFLSAALALAACNKEELPTPAPNADDIVRIAATTIAARDADAATRATINETDGTGSFQSGDEIGIWATPNYPQTYNISRTATFDGTAWTYNTPLLWSDLPEDQSGNGLYFIIGHYPVQTATPDQYGYITFSVQTNQNTAEVYRASDLLVSGTIELGGFVPVRGIKKGETVPLNFVHVMSRIKVTLTAGSNVTQEEVNAATVKIKNAQVNYKISLINGGNGDPDSPTYADITPLKSTTATATFYALLPRQDNQSGNKWIEIEVAVGGKVATYELSAVTYLYCGETQPVKLTLSRSGSSKSAATTRGRSAMGSVADDGLGELMLECTSAENHHYPLKQ